MPSITFRQFASVNVERSRKVWPQCDTWDERDWLDALDGEVGEARNILKKARRDGWTPELRIAFDHEIFDILAYCFLTLTMPGCEHMTDEERVSRLDQVTCDKWNEVSARNNYPVRL